MARPVRIRAALALAALLACSALVAGCAATRAASLYGSGTAALDRGEPERAVRDLEQAAALVPTASEIQNHLGLAYAAAGRETEAVHAFRRAVALDCDNGAARANLARAEREAREAHAP